jgi:threonine aldolase
MNVDPISRRSFMQSGVALPFAVAPGLSGAFAHGTRAGVRPGARPDDGDAGAELARLQTLVKLSGDGPAMSPREYAHLLSGIVADQDVEADYYSNGGVVEALEARMATLLGKERAVFLPTGTLANHLAVRLHGARGHRILVQEESHLYCDSGDCAQVLSNLNLVPLASPGGTFTLEQVEAAVHGAAGGRVPASVGAISIESPIRRRMGTLFDHQEMQRICAFARANGIGTHLDGARLFMASGYTGISPAAYASLFDTVYVSLWKYFNAPSGAVLAGPSALLDDLYHTRRMFGGGLPYAWPLAAAALHSIDGFEARFAKGVAAGESLKTALAAVPGLRVEEVSGGSNVFTLHVDGGDPDVLRAGLEAEGILLPGPSTAFRGFALGVNETWARRPVEEVAHAFARVLTR